MITKFESFAEEEEQREQLASRPDSNDPDGSPRSPTMSVKNKEGKEETFERSIFDPDKYI